MQQPTGKTGETGEMGGILGIRAMCFMRIRKLTDGAGVLMAGQPTPPTNVPPPQK